MPHYLIKSIRGEDYQFCIVDTSFSLTDLTNRQSVHIFASGPSVKQVDFSRLLNFPSIFVNGSIKLLSDHSFMKPCAYVISDARFIEHNFSIIEQHYHQQCDWYLTEDVLDKLIELAPDFLQKVHGSIKLIYNVTKSIEIYPTSKIHNFIKLCHQIFNKYFNPSAVVTRLSKNPWIQVQSPVNDDNDWVGTSLDIRHGYVEAGTVTYVATQLAYSLGFEEIYVHGMDLINSVQPRFYETSDKQAPSKLDKAVANRIVPSFDFLAETYQRQGVFVYNTSPVSQDLFKQLPYSNQFVRIT